MNLSTAGNWLFCNRRWLDPLKRDEREKLEHNYDKLCASFPAFARCSKNMFIQFLMDVTVAWTERIAETPRRPAAASATASASLPPNIHAQQHHIPNPSNAQATRYVMSYDQALRGPCPARPAEHRAIAPGDYATARDPVPSDLFPSDSDGSSPYDPAGSSPDDSADGGGAATPAAAALNAGEAVDLRLYQHWSASGPALRVEAGELERFGRSASF